MIRRAYDQWAAGIQPKAAASIARFALEVMGRDESTLRKVLRGRFPLPTTARHQLRIYVGDTVYSPQLTAQGRARARKRANGACA